MNWELIKNELRVSYETWMNIHMNELHLSCENDVHDSHLGFLNHVCGPKWVQPTKNHQQEKGVGPSGFDLQQKKTNELSLMPSSTCNIWKPTTKLC